MSPAVTLSNEYNPNELVVAIRLTPCESVSDTTTFRTPRPSGVVTRPDTDAVVIGVGDGDGVGVGVIVGVGVGVGVTLPSV